MAEKQLCDQRFQRISSNFNSFNGSYPCEDQFDRLIIQKREEDDSYFSQYVLNCSLKQKRSSSTLSNWNIKEDNHEKKIQEDQNELPDELLNLSKENSALLQKLAENEVNYNEKSVLMIDTTNKFNKTLNENVKKDIQIVSQNKQFLHHLLNHQQTKAAPQDELEKRFQNNQRTRQDDYFEKESFEECKTPIIKIEEISEIKLKTVSYENKSWKDRQNITKDLQYQLQKQQQEQHQGEEFNKNIEKSLVEIAFDKNIKKRQLHGQNAYISLFHKPKKTVFKLRASPHRKYSLLQGPPCKHHQQIKIFENLKLRIKDQDQSHAHPNQHKREANDQQNIQTIGNSSSKNEYSQRNDTMNQTQQSEFQRYEVKEQQYQEEIKKQMKSKKLQKNPAKSLTESQQKQQNTQELITLGASKSFDNTLNSNLKEIQQLNLSDLFETNGSKSNNHAKLSEMKKNPLVLKTEQFQNYREIEICIIHNILQFVSLFNKKKGLFIKCQSNQKVSSLFHFQKLSPKQQSIEQVSANKDPQTEGKFKISLDILQTLEDHSFSLKKLWIPTQQALFSDKFLNDKIVQSDYQKQIIQDINQLFTYFNGEREQSTYEEYNFIYTQELIQISSLHQVNEEINLLLLSKQPLFSNSLIGKIVPLKLQSYFQISKKSQESICKPHASPIHSLSQPPRKNKLKITITPRGQEKESLTITPSNIQLNSPFPLKNHIAFPSSICKSINSPSQSPISHDVSPQNGRSIINLKNASFNSKAIASLSPISIPLISTCSINTAISSSRKGKNKLKLASLAASQQNQIQMSSVQVQTNCNLLPSKSLPQRSKLQMNLEKISGTTTQQKYQKLISPNSELLKQLKITENKGRYPSPNQPHSSHKIPSIQRGEIFIKQLARKESSFHYQEDNTLPNKQVQLLDKEISINICKRLRIQEQQKKQRFLTLPNNVC